MGSTVPTIQREARLPVGLDVAWAFHESVAGLLAVTPDWLDPQFEARRETDGGWRRSPALTEPLDEGTVVALSVRPLGVGPRQRWRSVIEVARREPGAAVLRDRMVDGPFDHWVHTHAMYDAGDETLLRDRVEYRTRDGVAGALADRFVAVGLAATFRYRHRRTRAILERGWDGW